MRVAILALILALLAPALRADDAGLQFFEAKIRPVLADRCYSCHSATAKKLKADLYADSLPGLLKGGESGPALVPGHPEQSRLIEAITYKNSDLQMPPKDRLSDQQIEDLTQWVKLGAPWPAEKAGPAPATNAVAGSFNLQERKLAHWAWQPVKSVEPPAVKDRGWVRDPVDQFILAGLEAKQMHPAVSADRRTLLRRVTFDLTGLPPTPQEIETFLADQSPDAFAKVVDRLLASPRFGERWARHWLDLARYAETLGHEFDYVLPNAWRYRDYVIRAINADVPYNQFVVEQLAGDLLPNPRKNPVDGSNESIIGTGFLYFGESVHSPVDARQNQADLIDNRIDVTGKAILGMTIACARCHDHKFDAIAAADYYALYGLFESTRYAQRSINDDTIAAKVIELKLAREQVRQAVAASWMPQAANINIYLLAAQAVMGGETAASVCSRTGLDPKLLGRWVEALRDPAAKAAGHPAHPFVKFAAAKLENAPKTRKESVATDSTVSRKGDVELARFVGANFGNWAADGVAFGSRPTRPGDFTLGTSPDHPITRILPGGAASTAMVSPRLEGSLRSPTFTIDHPYLFVHATGHDARINFCIEGLNILRAPIYGGTKKALKLDKPGWQVFDLEMWQGRRAYLEFIDSTTPDEGDTNSYGPNGWISVDRVVASDEPKPPLFAAPSAAELMAPSAEMPYKSLAARYQCVATETIEAWAHGTLADAADAPARAVLLNWLVERGLLDSVDGDASVASLLAEAKRLEESLPLPIYVPAAADGNGIDEHVFIRGSYKNLGPQVPRRSLEALGGLTPPASCKGSGRLEIARGWVDPANPLVSRVMVNRVWHHLFGRGLVTSTDNFGRLGELPSNPQLLDSLAARFVSEGWSIKRLIRELVLTSTYQMSSRGDPRFDTADPENRLLHRMNLRRLEGEAIRDQILALSGRLDPTLYGPSINVNLTAFMEGRGRPPTGPLDGAGRRSIYLGVRRNFLSPMLLAFDMPTPFSAMGRRSVSNVPAQALMLMNDPFVVEQAKLWSAKVAADAASPEERVARMYETAFARPPTPAETAAALAFVDRQAAAWNIAGSEVAGDARPWADLAHVLMNLKEFIFIN